MTNIKSYIALFETDKEVKTLGVVFPDLPGFITTGDNFDDAYKHAQELLQIASVEYAKDGKALPNPRTLEEIKSTWEDWDEWKNNYTFEVVRVHYCPVGKPLKYTVYLDSDLVARIDSVTNNRSLFLSKAAEKMLNN